MTASDANLVGMYDQGLGVQPDVVEAHMWLTAVFCHRAGVGIRVRYRQPDGSPHHVFARRSRAGDRVTSPVPVPTLQDRAGPLLATRNLRLGPRPHVLHDRLRYRRIGSRHVSSTGRPGHAHVEHGLAIHQGFTYHAAILLAW